jgi:hypothetical protein
MAALDDVLVGLARGQVIPYLGPGLLAATPGSEALPSSPAQLVQRLTAKASVPHKVRNNLTAAAQFIENFKHRKTVMTLMTEAFSAEAAPGALHHYLAALPELPLIVSMWYDDLLQQALRTRQDWGLVQGVSQAEHFGTWVHYYQADGTAVTEADAQHWSTVLYQPLGAIAPAKNFLVSDSDYVEVLTEIDIQTPIPPMVQRRRRGRQFLFLGCRFGTQLERLFARQIMKRSSDHHWALLEGELTRNEARFLKEMNIHRIDLSLLEFLARAGAASPMPLATAV